MKNKHILIFLLTLPTILFGQTEHPVQPNTADPLSGAPNNYHFTYINQGVTQKNKLFLFFPGTGGVPYGYREILKHAANLGYHSIGLTYPNSEAINQICATSTDTTCHSRARLEIFDGTDRHADVSVDKNNCIEQRTLKLLEYLHSTYPTENWGQYYSGNQIQWNKIIVSGHSQGGGHAGIISKIKQVDRVVMFAAMDWIILLNRNADWITWEGPTSADRYFGFTHQNDEAVDFSKLQITWDNYGMNSSDNLVLVDGTNNPYNSQTLYTLQTPANDPSQYHGCIVTDAYTPTNLGIPIFAPVWTYVLEGSGTSTSITKQSTVETITVSPNPTSSTAYIHCLNCEQKTYELYNYQGQIVTMGLLTDKKIDVSYLNSGIYFLKILNGNVVTTIEIIKE